MQYRRRNLKYSYDHIKNVTAITMQKICLVNYCKMTALIEYNKICVTAYFTLQTFTLFHEPNKITSV